ncbi:penicillin-binding protein 1A [uncultured Vibrio sp.]|uniref:penicillin-binding protein 1A n=1 Tax=uncultured Vibrio sp. TaxID=114054 RepID=UPI00091528D4|nr:PBP1A family penicillin-binding protein [uncultured Vibrio sp.]OIQ25396.1 MAG: penicillin-sensitive transpeptidase [Vibrio sp. MedPE-SWchi]
MKFIKRLFIFTLFCIILGVGTIIGFYFYVKPDLPDVQELRHVELEAPMQVYSQDGKLIAQFGEKRRTPVEYDDIPQHLIDALIATEDSRFYSHYGIDPIGIARAAVVVAMSGSAKQGASTITQQLARNFFLSNEKKIMRKIKEIFLAIRIEQSMSKEEILQLYVNKIFLGYRSYGFGAAAQTYFGHELNELTLSELATLAGMPKAPSTMNPIYSLERATHRRNVVLRRMLDENYISQSEFDEARAEEIESRYHSAEIELRAPYVAELARAWMVEQYGEAAYTQGMSIYTTVDSKLQKAANTAAIENLIAYDERHGYRKPTQTAWNEGEAPLSVDEITRYLRSQPIYGSLRPAVVVGIGENTISVEVKGRGNQSIEWEEMKWARPFINDDRQGKEPQNAREIATVGELVWVREVKQPESETTATAETIDSELGEEVNADMAAVKTIWRLSQVPEANTAFVAMNPENGAVMSLVGGFNFVHNKFNRATQSVRQVGSSIKPFIYAAAMDDGMTLATLINDAPINQWDKSQGTAWRPRNSPPTYIGPTRVRIGLATSKNVMAVRVLRAVGLDDTRDYLTRFGFEIDELPRSETIALGAGSLTPVKMAQGYSVFANGGYYVDPFYISRVETRFGDLEWQATPKEICRQDCDAQTAVTIDDNEFMEQDVDADVQYAPQVLSEQTAFLMREMMYSNVWGGGNWREGTGWNGTGWRAQPLKRRDIGGKTGTTNDSKDAWYNGYGPGMVAISWVGFDNHNRKLGKTTANKNLGKNQITGGEAGAKTAQPAWVNFMQVALDGIPAQSKQIPSNIVRVRIDRDSGLLTNKFDSSSMFEYFLEGTEPTEYVEESIGDTIYSNSGGEELF